MGSGFTSSVNSIKSVALSRPMPAKDAKMACARAAMPTLLVHMYSLYIHILYMYIQLYTYADAEL